MPEAVCSVVCLCVRKAETHTHTHRNPPNVTSSHISVPLFIMFGKSESNTPHLHAYSNMPILIFE